MKCLQWISMEKGQDTIPEYETSLGTENSSLGLTHQRHWSGDQEEPSARLDAQIDLQAPAQK